MDIDRDVELLRRAGTHLRSGFSEMPIYADSSSAAEMEPILEQLALKLHNNYPYFHPLYAGQMLKPPHPVARLAYALSLYVNPNNHALDGGRATSALEKECVADIARMFGWTRHLGHLCSGGTIANMEALWVANRIRPGEKIVASALAHYTHERICSVLGIEFAKVPYDDKGRMSSKALEKMLNDGSIGTVVVTLGTTACGTIDPLGEILNLRDRYGFRVHVDAAYGGYYSLTDTLTKSGKAAFDSVSRTDSIVVDPHKHGLQPYGCGCVIFSDPSVGALYKHDSPYTYFTSAELHLGEISLECSRPGSSAAALWATQQLLPLEKGGRFARDLEKARSAALHLHELIEHDGRFVTCFPPELDILFWFPRCGLASTASRLSQEIFDAAAAMQLHLALARMPKSLVEPHAPDVTWDDDSILCLRVCLMKPDHADWVSAIWERISLATESVFSNAEAGR